jgi:hypothetical protein
VFNIIANPIYFFYREASKPIFSDDLIWFGTIFGTAVTSAVQVRVFVEEPRLIVLGETLAQGLRIFIGVSSRLLYINI